MEKIDKEEYLYIFCDEYGKIQYQDYQKVFFVKAWSKIRIILPPGALSLMPGKLKSDDVLPATLIMNLPYQENGEAFYTMAEPFTDWSDSKVEEIKNKYGNEYDSYFAEFDPQINDLGGQNYDVTLNYPGVFFFQFRYSSNLYTDPQYIQVDPDLQNDHTNLNINSLRIMTVLSRWLGKLERWESFVKAQQKLGYNAIHFTPIQEYGGSFSHYSLANQLTIDDWYFDDKDLTPKQRLTKLKYTINKLQIETGMLFFIDIVLNHTSGDSEWIKLHPDSTYNTDNCPYLTVAWVLDKALTDFDIKFAENLKNDIKSEQDVNSIMEHIESKIIRPLLLFEYFYIDIDAIPDLKQVKAITGVLIETMLDDDNLCSLDECIKQNVEGEGEKRYGVRVDFDKVLEYIVKQDPEKDSEFYLLKLREFCDSYNSKAFDMANGFINEALGAIRGEILYKKVQLPEQHRVKPGKRMLTSYFRQLDNPQKTKCVHNGWSMAGDASKQDFWSKDWWFYFRRFIIAWGDCVKLRFGYTPVDSPYLWKHMSQYVCEISKIFDGIRLDNCHSTPKHVAKFMLQTLRTANPNSYVLAEFFTNSRESEAEATRELGINGLIREMQNYGNCKDLSTQCHGYGGWQEYIVGKLDDSFLDHSTGKYYKKVQQRYPLPVFYDMTHDNPSTIEKFWPGTISLPHLALNSFLCCSISSTYGFDILLPQNLDLVKENRCYKILDDIPEVINDTINDKFTIQFEDSKATCVDIAGTFSNWSVKRMNNENGLWTIQILKYGNHEFKFIVDGEWKASQDYPTEPVNGNNVLEFEEGSTIFTDLRYGIIFW